jgi:ATP-dependent DNA ligase
MLELLNNSINQMKLITDSPDPSIDLSTIKLDAYFKPVMVFEVHAQELTYSPLYKLGSSEYGGLSLRFPAFKCIRADKGPREATSGE